MKNTSKKDRIYKRLISILILAVILIAVMAHITEPKFTPYEEVKDRITINDNYGILTLSVTERYELFKSKRTNDIIVNPDSDKVRAIYYVSNSEVPNKVIYQNASLESGVKITLPRLVLNAYFFWAILNSLVLTALTLLFIKKVRLRNSLIYILFFPLAYILSHLFIKGLSCISYAPIHDFTWIIVLAIPIYLLLFILFQGRVHKKTNSDLMFFANAE